MILSLYIIVILLYFTYCVSHCSMSRYLSTLLSPNSPLLPPLHFPFCSYLTSIPKKSPLSFHALTWNPFCNPFVFTFMRVMGGVPPLPERTLKPQSGQAPALPLQWDAR